jgi:hypothetical protein
VRGNGEGDFINVITCGDIYVTALIWKWSEVPFILRLAMRFAVYFVSITCIELAQQIIPPFEKLSKYVTMFHYCGAFFRFEIE